MTAASSCHCDLNVELALDVPTMPGSTRVDDPKVFHVKLIELSPPSPQ